MQLEIHMGETCIFTNSPLHIVFVKSSALYKLYSHDIAAAGGQEQTPEAPTPTMRRQGRDKPPGDTTSPMPGGGAEQAAGAPTGTPRRDGRDKPPGEAVSPGPVAVGPSPAKSHRRRLAGVVGGVSGE